MNNIPVIQRTGEKEKLFLDSYFEIEFLDGTVRTEKDTNWSDIAKEETVKYYGKSTKIAAVCSYAIKRIAIHHRNLHTELFPLDNDRVYQAIRSETLFYDNGEKTDSIVGRLVGLVRHGEIVQERYLDNTVSEIVGFRK